MANTPHHEVSWMCDDRAAASAEMSAQGVEFTGEVEDQGWGLVIHFEVPGAGQMQLYEPRHPVAHSLPG